MKAKNSLMAMLWPLVSALYKMKNRLFDNKNAEKFKTNPLSLELQKVSAESKRIAEKLQETRQLKATEASKNQYPGVLPLPENKPLEPDEEDEELVLSRWREDEDDRTRTNEYEFWNYRQNLLRADHPDIMEGNLLALFKADHDAAQFEQYQLENERTPPESETLAVSQLRRFLSGGLNFLLVVIFIMGAATRPAKAQDIEFEERPTYTVGDRVPDFTIGNLLNSDKKSVRLSDYKGKLLILDFWATWCSYSSLVFNKEDSLERKFKGQVAFLPVSYQSSAEVNGFLTRLRESSPRSLPQKEVLVATGDHQLRRMFPHITLPHFVWIGPDGKVKAITDYTDVTEGNIADALKGKNLNVALKKEIRIPYVDTVPMLVNNNGGDGSNLVYHSVFTRYKEGLSGSARFFRNDPVKGSWITVKNMSIRSIAQYAYSDGYLNFGTNRIAIEVKDPGRITNSKIGAEYTNWLRENGYGYEIIIPPSLNGQVFQLMQADLKRLFPQYDIGLEKRNTKCLALVRTSKIDKLKSKGSKPEVKVDDFGLQLTNAVLYNFVYPLDYYYLQNSPVPVIDETGYIAPVDLHLKASLTNVPAMNKELEKYDLQFIETTRMLDILVFKDHKN